MSKREHDPSDTDRETRNEGSVKLARQIEINDLKWLMSSKQGRRIAWRLLEKAGIYRTTFTGNSETFFKEGMRSMGLFLVAEIHAAAPEAYALMLIEAREKTE